MPLWTPGKAMFMPLLATGALVAAASLFAIVAAASSASDDDSDDPFTETMEWADDDIDDFWKDLERDQDFDYHAPAKVEYYTSEYSTPCGDTIPNNAFYCSEDNSIYMDQAFLEKQFNEVGVYSPVYILAHEWGHLIQNDLGILTSPNFSIQVELQADCFAGAYTRYLDATNETFTEEDLAAARATLVQVGDPDLYPWFAPGAHGDSDQRVQAFEIGYDEGFERCTEPPFGQAR